MNPVHTGGSSHHASHFAHPARNVSVFGIEHGMKVADFGAGSGVYTLEIAELLSGSGTVFAVDVQKDLLRRIKNEANRRHLNNVEVIWGDLEKAEGSKIKEHTLDVVLISNLLFQLEDKKAPLVEAKRILKPSGHLVIIDWSESYGGMGPIKEHVFSKDAAIALTHKQGFALSKEFAAGAHHYGLICISGQPLGTRKLVVH